MELAAGKTLDQVVPKEGLSVPRFFELGVAMADAVSGAHERGVAHRDLKPGNIVVDDNDRLKILDFGLAKSPEAPIVKSPTDDSTESTSTDGRLRGTISFMSPEQVKGLAVDYRSDLFSLGVMLYEMATGCRPFRGDSAAELLASILRDEPCPVTELRPELPRQIDRIIGHTLEKDPERRLRSALDLRDDLQHLREEFERGGTAACSMIRSVAVLPLDDLSADPEDAWFADGMTDALINGLARIGALKVISRTSVMQYKQAMKPLRDIARELRVDAVIEGSVLRAGMRVRVTVQLIDAARDLQLWAESYEHGMDEVLALQSRIAQAIAGKIELELTPQERVQLERTGPVNPEAHEACLKGRHFWYKRTTESVRRGLKSFKEAVRLDPSYSPAYAGIADSYIVDGGRYLGVSPDVAYASARSAALKAVELDETLAEAHTSLAAVMTDYDWDWEGADREYRRAIELNPNYATAHSWYAEQLSRMGRHDEAVAEARQARELDPLSLVSGMILSWILYFARRYDESIQWARRTLDLDPDYATAHRILGWSLEETGNHDEAIVAHERASFLTEGQSNFSGQLGRAYALAGRTGEAREVLKSLLELSERVYVSSLDIAIIYSALGDNGLALDWLERAHEERADHLPYIRVHPRLDPLRDEPRFKRVLEDMGLA